MSTISVAQKSKSLNILDNRNISLMILAALVTVLVAVVTISVASSASKAFDLNAYKLYRQGEWLSAPVSNAEAYQIFRLGEVTSPMSNADAYMLYRQGEWNSVAIPAVDLSAYQLSERTLIDPNAGLSVYHLSERSLVDPQAGMAIYHSSERTLSVPQVDLAAYSTSERTLIPVQFNQYQLSEWFGQ